MTERQSRLLKTLIEKYIETAEPVASALLANKIKVSSATTRNDMAELEELGFISQPHTSAGRIPTIKGYQLYLETYFQPKKPSHAEQQRIDQSIQSGHPIKGLAKELAEQINLAVLVALADNDFYYTGLSKLFAQPEFSQHDHVINVSSVLDKLDEALKGLFESIDKDVSIFLGEDNPFSTNSSLLLTKTKVENQTEGILGIVGPVRLDYNRASGLLNHAKMTLNKHYS